MNPQDVAAVAAEVERVSSGAKVIEQTADGEGYGLLLVERPGHHQPWVVWRWATKRTDGSPVGGQSGAMLWSGSYWDERKDAEWDMRSRPRR